MTESATIWMGDLEKTMDASFITEAFANVGYTAVEVKEIFHKSTGDRASYCFVDFGGIDIAREVLIKVNNQPIPGTNGKKFKLNRSEYGRSSGGNIEYSMFVGDITSDVHDDHLLDFFRCRYPSVRAAKVVKDNKGIPKGYGFVRFFDDEEHQRALKEMQGMKGLGQRAIRVNKATTGKSHTQQEPSQMNMEPGNFPGWMQMQMNYMQQMQQYMQQCHQYAQQAASYAGMVPQSTQDRRHSASDQEAAMESRLTMIQKQHEQMLAQTAVVNEDLDLVDPNPVVDVAALNKEIIDLDDKLFFELEDSRWDPELSIICANQQRPLRVR